MALSTGGSMLHGSDNRRIPKQKRSEETRERILEAGQRLFAKFGYHDTSSKKIAYEAGISVGSFYNYFEDKKQLLFEIHRRHARQVHAMIAEMLGSADFGSPETDGRDIVRTVIAQTLRMHDYSPGFHREMTALMYADPDFAELGRREEDRTVGMLMQILEPHRGQLRVDDLEAAARVVVLAVEEVVHAIKIFGTTIEEHRMIDALGDMVHRYLYRGA
jgi:AcrR family transcriptional regulator